MLVARALRERKIPAKNHQSGRITRRACIEFGMRAVIAIPHSKANRPKILVIPE
jgi:hypothetical protein